MKTMLKQAAENTIMLSTNPDQESQVLGGMFYAQALGVQLSQDQVEVGVEDQ